jgi:hypothetical protein
MIQTMEHPVLAPVQGSKCRLLIRQHPDPTEVLQFVASGLEVGQQIVVLAGPAWLKDIAEGLNTNRLRPEVLLRNGRLIFLTAPDCFAYLARHDDPWRRNGLRLNGSIVRWVSDWSWAYGSGHNPADILNYQRCIHSRIHEVTALSLCTVHCSRMERSSLLKMLGHHRHALRTADEAV